MTPFIKDELHLKPKLNIDVQFPLNTLENVLSLIILSNHKSPSNLYLVLIG